MDSKETLKSIPPRQVVHQSETLFEKLYIFNSVILLYISRAVKVGADFPLPTSAESFQQRTINVQWKESEHYCLKGFRQGGIIVLLLPLLLPTPPNPQLALCFQVWVLISDHRDDF